MGFPGQIRFNGDCGATHPLPHQFLFRANAFLQFIFKKDFEGKQVTVLLNCRLSPIHVGGPLCAVIDFRFGESNR